MATVSKYFNKGSKDYIVFSNNTVITVSRQGFVAKFALSYEQAKAKDITPFLTTTNLISGVRITTGLNNSIKPIKSLRYVHSFPNSNVFTRFNTIVNSDTLQMRYIKP